MSSTLKQIKPGYLGRDKDGNHLFMLHPKLYAELKRFLRDNPANPDS